MAKSRIKYICTNCGFESLKWQGKCPSCLEWNTFSEEYVEEKKRSGKINIQNVNPVPINLEVEVKVKRVKTSIEEFDRVLGGGLMPGSVVLIGGDPGVGKSTLVLQAAALIDETVLYVTGEESLDQIHHRAKRLKVVSEKLLTLAETNVEIISAAIEKTKPAVVVIDSIQTMFRPELENAPGTVSQVRETTAYLMQLSKQNNFTTMIVGHVTKEGYIAGPKMLEHIVDTVIQFEGEKNHSFRILRAQKNRFGSTNEIGIFEMHETGLMEVSNASEIFLSEREIQTSGSVVTASIEGTRPVLLEVQSLVTPSNFGNPQRVATGFDYRRLSILLAVLEKRAQLRVSSSNVFLNMAGGLKVDEPAVDLAVCCAIASNLSDKPVKSDIVIVGEVGLGGEVRSIGNIDKRIAEAEKLGFRSIILPKNNLKSIKSSYKIEIIPVASLKEAISKVL